MRTIQSVMLFVLCLGLTLLFQNCGGNSVSLSKTLPSTSGSTYTSLGVPVHREAALAGEDGMIDLSDLRAPIDTLDFSILVVSEDLVDLRLPSMNLPNGTTAMICAAGPGAVNVSGPFELTVGVFLKNSVSEIFIRMQGVTGSSDPTTGSMVITQLTFDVFVRPNGISSTKFEAALCDSGPAMGAGSTSPSTIK